MGFNKTYTLYAGVNGAGKSTMYKVISPDSTEARINSDEILATSGGGLYNDFESN